MRSGRPGLSALIVTGIVLAVLLMGVLYVRQTHLSPKPPLPPAAPIATTQPATQVVVLRPSGPQSYLELVRHLYPDFPTTQPLSRPLLLSHAGHFVLEDPVYLDAQGRLWITRADAEPVATVLSAGRRQTVYLTTERPLFVHWMLDRQGEWVAMLVCLNRSGNGFELVSAESRRPLGEGLEYEWGRAFSWEQRIVVPTRHGVSVFGVGQRIYEMPCPSLADASAEHAPVEIAFMSGPLAWIPPTEAHPGSAGAVRFIEDNWFRLAEDQGWSAAPIHVVPLLDGTVILLLAAGDGTVKLSIITVEPMDPAEQQKIAEHIAQLSDPDPNARQEAFSRLTQYGPGLWPVAEKLMDGEPPETQSRLRDLLKARTIPLLGGMQLMDGRLQLVSRHPSGGALFYADRGVTLPRGSEAPQLVSPAWLSIRPGQPVELLPRPLTQELDVAKTRLVPWGREWIVMDDVHGARSFLESGPPVPLLRRDELDFRHFVGVDRDGRYLFRKEMADSLAAPMAGGPTLVIDPRLPDPTPRLPAWQLVYPTGTVGWDQHDWPAAKQGGAWALGTREWRAMEEKEPFYTSLDQVPHLATQPATQPAATQGSEPPLLVDEKGNRYFDGRAAMRVVCPGGREITWPLPDIATGSEDVRPWLARSSQGVLFLYNTPGRLLRIRPAFDSPEPFRIEATFTRRIPNARTLTRMWIDPHGRLCIAFDGNKLTILFPEGYIPPETAPLITGEVDELE